MKSIISAFLVIFALAAIASAQSAVITPEDLKLLEGPKWTGTLTYQDYKTNKPTSIKSELSVSRPATDIQRWQFAYTYPDEPKANSSSEAVIDNGGRRFFGEDVIEKSSLRDNILRLVTTQRGTDNNKPALFRYTYLIGSKTLSIRKEVKADGTETYFERNVYRWTR